MTLGAIDPKTALMHLRLDVAGYARLGGTFEDPLHVAGCTLQGLVLPGELERRQVVVEVVERGQHAVSTAMLGMATATLHAFA